LLLFLLQAQGSCPKNIRLEDYAKQVLPPQVHHELLAAINNNRWLEWEHFDQVWTADRGWLLCSGCCSCVER
jgi:hypothetical protein